jgi:hypothetical protein
MDKDLWHFTSTLLINNFIKQMAVIPLSFARQATLTLSRPAGHICPDYKESFQVRWANRTPFFSMLHSSIAHSIICTRVFRGKMHSDWFNGIEILQGRLQH